MSAALIYTHAFGLLVIVAQYGFMALSKTRGGIPRHRWLKAQAGLALLSAPMLAYGTWRLLGPLLIERSSAPIDWIPIPSTIAVTPTVLAYLGYPPSLSHHS